MKETPVLKFFSVKPELHENESSMSSWNPGELIRYSTWNFFFFYYYCLTCLATCNFFIFGLAVTVIPNIGHIALVVIIPFYCEHKGQNKDWYLYSNSILFPFTSFLHSCILVTGNDFALSWDV